MVLGVLMIAQKAAAVVISGPENMNQLRPKVYINLFLWLPWCLVKSRPYEHTFPMYLEVM